MLDGKLQNYTDWTVGAVMLLPERGNYAYRITMKYQDGASRDVPIRMMVLFNVLMGLRRQEILGLKYSAIDYIKRTISVERQLGRAVNTRKGDFAPKPSRNRKSR